MRKVGILGGTFNPIHKGHVALGKAALRVFNLDKVFFIPTGESYHKKGGNILSGEERLKLVSLALENVSKLIPLGIDIERKGPTYTIDTINELKKIESDSQFYIILGSDVFKYIEQWNNIEILAKKVFFIVVVRAGEDKKVWRFFVKTMLKCIRNKTFIMPFKPYFISSTDIHYEGIKKSKEKLDEKVYHYILAKGLYNNDI